MLYFSACVLLRSPVLGRQRIVVQHLEYEIERSGVLEHRIIGDFVVTVGVGGKKRKDVMSMRVSRGCSRPRRSSSRCHCPVLVVIFVSRWTLSASTVVAMSRKASPPNASAPSIVTGKTTTWASFLMYY